MSDIFISYASDDRPRAKALAEVLAREGWSVWWDRRIPVGETFGRVIEKQIRAAKSVIVLWSKAALESDWVQNEASEGMQRRILAPVFIEDVQPPFAFRQIQAARLIDWNGETDSIEFIGLREALSTIIGRRESLEEQPTAEAERQACEKAAAERARIAQERAEAERRKREQAEAAERERKAREQAEAERQQRENRPAARVQPAAEEQRPNRYVVLGAGAVLVVFVVVLVARGRMLLLGVASGMGIIAWLVVGLVAGFIASKIVNRAGEGAILDIVLGIIGAIVGGAIFERLGYGGVTGINIFSIAIAVVGSVLVLFVYHLITGQRAA